MAKTTTPTAAWPTEANALLAWLFPGQSFWDAWEKRPLVAKGVDRHRFDSLLSQEAIRGMLDRDAHFARNVMVCRAVGPERRREEATPDHATADTLWQLFHDGFTLQVFQPQQHSPAVAALCRTLEVRDARTSARSPGAAAEPAS